jgi:hypothetical protein
MFKKAQDQTERHAVTSVTKQEERKLQRLSDKSRQKKLTSGLDLMNCFFAQRRLLLSISTVVKICSVAHLRDLFYLKRVGCKL